MVTNRSSRGFLADKSVAPVRVHLSAAVTLMWGANLQTKSCSPIATLTPQAYYYYYYYYYYMHSGFTTVENFSRW